MIEDEIIHQYIMDAMDNTLITNDEYREILEMYVDDVDLINSILTYRLNNQTAKGSHVQPPVKHHHQPLEQVANPVCVDDARDVRKTIDKDIKSYIVSKFSYAADTGPANNIRLPEYLSTTAKKTNQKRFYNGMIVSSKGEKYIATE